MIAQPLPERDPCTDPCNKRLRAFYWQILRSCKQPFLTRAHLSTQANSLTSPQSICVMASCGPSLIPSPGVTWLPNFSSSVQPVTTVPPGVCHQLCVNYCVFIPPATPSIQSRSLLAWVCKLATLGREGATKSQSLTRLSFKAAAAAVVSGAGPRDPPISLQNFLTVRF